MAGGRVETYSCDAAFAKGSHDGANAASSLRRMGADFKSCGVEVGMPIYNTTQVTSGLITAVTENEVTDDTNTWNKDDEYEIYMTTKNAVVSSIWTDLSRGWKADPKELDRGWQPEDVDLDRDDPHVFGPGQPENVNRRGGR